MTHTRNIYILRAQCTGDCGLDKMVSFYRVPNGRPRDMARGHKKVLKQRFPERYGCSHKIKFTLELEKEYVWDIDEQKAVKRGTL